jgi:peptide/nickel transport system substrate-binding protein
VDEQLRRELYGQAQEMMAREVPAIIPVFVDLLAAKHHYVQGYRHHPRGAIYNLERVWLDEGAPKRT